MSDLPSDLSPRHCSNTWSITWQGLVEIVATFLFRFLNNLWIHYDGYVTVLTLDPLSFNWRMHSNGQTFAWSACSRCKTVPQAQACRVWIPSSHSGDIQLFWQGLTSSIWHKRRGPSETRSYTDYWRVWLPPIAMHGFMAKEQDSILVGLCQQEAEVRSAFWRVPLSWW